MIRFDKPYFLIILSGYLPCYNDNNGRYVQSNLPSVSGKSPLTQGEYVDTCSGTPQYRPSVSKAEDLGHQRSRVFAQTRHGIFGALNPLELIFTDTVTVAKFLRKTGFSERKSFDR